jgi:hypothetical protein
MTALPTPPAYPKRCPICGERVYPLYHSETYAPPVPPVEEWAWEWTARCWRGHLVDPLPEQLTLIAQDDAKEAT